MTSDMDSLINWLKENLGNDIEVVSSPHNRIEKLEYEYIPSTPEQFKVIIEQAPWEILKGMGFRKWDTMNNIIQENIECAEKNKNRPTQISIPIINSDDLPDDPNECKAMNIEDGNYIVDLSQSGSEPMALLEQDMDIIMIPGEWYGVIPNGFIVTGLYGEEYAFEKGKSDDDIRFGCLPYGFKRPVVNI